MQWSAVECSAVQCNAVKITMFSTIEPCKSLDSTLLDQREGRICLIYILCKSAPHTKNQFDMFSFVSQS